MSSYWYPSRDEQCLLIVMPTDGSIIVPYYTGIKHHGRYAYGSWELSRGWLHCLVPRLALLMAVMEVQ